LKSIELPDAPQRQECSETEQMEMLNQGSRMPALSQSPLFTVHADLADILQFGATPVGERRVIHILGGRVEGPRFTGRILPGGADWQVIRPDGAADIEARYTLESAQGGLVLVSSEGLRHGPPDILARLARGEAVDPAHYYFRTLMRFETADPALAWMNRILAIAHGARLPNAVKLDVHEVL
jgi:hypothetical protein